MTKRNPLKIKLFPNIVWFNKDALQVHLLKLHKFMETVIQGVINSKRKYYNILHTFLTEIFT